MRWISVLMIVLIVALLACTTLLWYRPSLWPEVAARVRASPAELLPAADRESPFATPDEKRNANAKPTPLLPSDATQQPEPASPENAAAPAVIYPFPTKTRIRVGASKTDILATFGPAQVTVIGADRGELQERMIYSELPTGRKSIIVVINGRVTSADTYVAFDHNQK